MGDLFALAKDVQDAVETEFDAANVALPDRRYVASGRVVFDCAQLTVEIGALATGTAGADSRGSPRLGELPVAVIVVSLIRDCQPVPSQEGSPPTPEDIEAVAVPLLVDADLLVRTFLKKPHRTVGGCQALKVLSCVPYGPEGGVAGWILTLRVTV